MSSKKRSESESYPKEGCEVYEYFYHGANFVNCGKNVNDFKLDEFLRGTGD